MSNCVVCHLGVCLKADFIEMSRTLLSSRQRLNHDVCLEEKRED